MSSCWMRKSREHEKKKSRDDTIAAIATPTGSGGIGIVRISGPKSLDIFNKIFRPHKIDAPLTPYLLRYGTIASANGNTILDEALSAFMPGPKSFTGEEMAELYCHAGRFTLSAVLDAVIACGARPAEAGEFSLRRFANRGVDLTTLEGAAEMVAAKTDLACRLSREHLLGRYGEHVGQIRKRLVHLLAEIEADIDFPDEDAVGGIGRELLGSSISDIIADLQHLAASYKAGRIVQDGYRVIILGPPNAGKSSLFNRFVNDNRALVTPIPGTTRDYLSEWIEIDGLPVELFDTAGLRRGRGTIERAGIASTETLVAKADLIIYLVDGNAKIRPIPPIKLNSGQTLIIAINKCDLDDSRGARAEKWRRMIMEDVLPQDRACHREPLSSIRRGGSAKGRGNLSSAKQIEITTFSPPQAGTPRNDVAQTQGVTPYIAAPCFISAKTGEGIDLLLQTIWKQAGMADLTESLVVTSHRHKNKIDKCLRHLRRVQKSLNQPPEIISLELRQAANQIGEITGQVYTEQILDEIFSSFCIGK